jgi:hypothetical protein
VDLAVNIQPVRLIILPKPQLKRQILARFWSQPDTDLGRCLTEHDRLV